MSRVALAPIERAVRALRALPGIGEKTAARLTYFLLAAPEAVAFELGEALGRLRRDVTLCSSCFDLTERDPCAICSDPARSGGQLCVVEEPADVAAIEQTGAFRGRYHVLGGALSPLDGVGPERLRLRPLLERARAGELLEVILAMNPNPEGEATALFLSEQLAPFPLQVTRIGYGIPVGGDLEYLDPVTVARSLEGRRRISPS
jgi:recombination protein RecR